MKSTNDIVLLLDARNRIVELTHAAQHLISVAASEAIGQPVEQVWPEWPGQTERPPGNRTEPPKVVLSRGDEQHAYEVHISPLVNGRDTLASHVVVLHDVTERKPAEEALRKLNDELEDRVLARTAGLTRINARLVREIGEYKRAEAELVQHNRELLSLQSAAAATTSCLDLLFVLDTVTWEMVSLLEVEGCAISAWDQETDTVSVTAEYGSTDWEEEKLVQVYDLANYPLRKRVLAERYAQQMTISQSDTDPAELAYMQKANLKTLLMLPMVFQNRVVGLVEMKDSRVERAFTDREVSLAQLLATQAASAIENARLYERAQREISERMRAEEQIKASLREKEVLLKEIHHRVKNNLQVISSLLSLQSRCIEDQSVLKLFQESQNRVRSMALIHEKLYRSQDLTRINFAEYIRNLATSLLRSYRANSGPVSLKVNANDVSLSIDAAVPCGLIINELVSNSLKYAFPPLSSFPPDGGDERGGEIRIEIRSDRDHQVTLIVADNGVGFPKGLDFRHTESLGMQLVNTLTNQLDGTVELHSNGGTEFKITFATS
jgi:two-component sensor histidine kinase